MNDLLNDETDYILPENGIGIKLWNKVLPGQSLSKGHSKTAWLGHVKCSPNTVCHTLNAGNNGGKAHYRWDKPEVLPSSWWVRVFTFPDNFNFIGNQSSARYLIGMSVPPFMMQRISNQIAHQWFGKLELMHE